MIILKIILFILLAVLGIILLVLFLPVSAEVSFIGEKVSYRVRYAFVNLLDSEGKGVLGFLAKDGKENKPPDKSGEKSGSTAQTDTFPEQKKDKKRDKNEKKSAKRPEAEKKSETKESVSGKSSGEPQKKTETKSAETLGGKVRFLMDIWGSARRPLRKILRGFHINDVYIDFLVADEDAYNCAIKYGRICTALYNALAKFEGLFTVRYKTVDVECGFGKDKCRWDAGCKVHFLPITAVISGIWFLITYIFRIYIPDKRKNKKSAEKRNVQPQGGM